MGKRQRYLITSLLLSGGFLFLQFFPDFRLITIIAIGFLSIALFYWSLYESLGFDLTLLGLILPVSFTLAVGLFWFLLPSNIITQVLIVVLFAIGIYALCLTANIYTVSAIRTIALLRAARGVGFVLTLFTIFLLFDTIISIRTSIFLTAILIFISVYPLILQGNWAIVLSKEFDGQLFLTSLILAFVIAEFSVVLYFWPVSVVVGSLLLTIFAYILLGLSQSFYERRLFVQTIREYLVVGLSIFILILITTNWRG